MIWLICGLTIAFLFFADVASAQVTILHNFDDGSMRTDGADLSSGLILAPDGSFYGSTSKLYNKSTGRSSKAATIYRVTTTGVVTILKTFPFKTFLEPIPLLAYKREILATSARGPGSSKDGAFLGLSEANGVWHTSVWYKFGTNCSTPSGSLIVGPDGYIYGTAFAGGSGSGGTIYKIDPTSHKESVVYNFTLYGAWGPDSLLLANDGNYYGTTFEGPIANESTIFKMTPSGSVTTIYTFTDGNQLGSLIQGADGNFYGTCSYAAQGTPTQYGMVFKMTPAYDVSILHTFGQGSDGQLPGGVVESPNGNLYGTTDDGGTAGKGTIYELSTDGTSYTVLHNFDDGSVPNDGQYPIGLTLGADNNFYGTTSNGGTAGRGTVFRCSP
jgi:uncharacterized repeat protein (TIGR03803 family)